MAETRSGKWSVWLNACFLIVIAIAVILVNVLGVLSYDNHWWDITVPILALTTIVALIIGIRAVIKNSEHAASIYISMSISILAILFMLLHSLFISD